MTRRELLSLVAGVALLDTLFRRDLFAEAAKPIAQRWLAELHQMCRDLKAERLRPAEWQREIDRLHRRLPLPDLLKLIDFEKNVRGMKYPDLGVVTINPELPAIEGFSEKYSFVGKIFGMSRDRAIIPHGHKNMVSCHRVLKGEFELRQYDRIRDEADCMYVRQTVEERAMPGSFSSTSEEKNNVHWLIARSEHAYTFDVIVGGLNQNRTKIENVDLAAAEKAGVGLLRAQKLDVETALRKYGKSHH